MKRVFWILVVVAMTTSCDCGGGENNGSSDTGADATPSPDGGADSASDAAGDAADDAAPDMTRRDGFLIPDLDGQVKVTFDQWGVLHAECQTDNDCAAVQGYHHAAHRFFQMDQNRRVAQGRVSELIGNLALDFDESMRLTLSTRDGQPLAEAMYESAEPPTKELLQAYTRGVNAFLDDYRNGRNGATLSEEYDFDIVEKTEIPDWTPVDSVASALLLLDDLSNSSGSDLNRGDDYEVLSPEIAFDLLGTMSATQTATMPASGETYMRPNALLTLPQAAQMQPALDRMRASSTVIDLARARMDEVARFRGKNLGLTGSNNWVIGPGLTKNGKPLLANDPHLALFNPSLWYLVELDSKTNGTGSIHVTGVSLPGLPGVLLGHNETIAWGATVIFYDLADVYIETLSSDGKSVRFNGQDVPIIEIEHTFQIARANPETRTLRWVPHHGPVLSYDAASGEATTLRWSGNDARTDVNMFAQINVATNVAEARDALRSSTSTNQNWIVADAAGDIAWYPYSSVPDRPWASLALPPWAPLPGDGSAEWGAYLDYDELPQMLNPTNGFVATANTDPTGATFDGDPTNDSFGYIASYGEFAGFREQAILDRIAAINGAGGHDAQTSVAMQGDTFMVLRDWVLPHVAEVVTNAGPLGGDAQVLWDVVVDWDGTCPTGIDGSDPDGPKVSDATEAAASIGCTAFHYLLTSLARATFDDELRDANINGASLNGARTLVLLLNRPVDLQAGEVYWDKTTTPDVETKEDIILGAITTAAQWIRSDFGSIDPDDWRWGRKHTLVMLAGLLDQTGAHQYRNGPFATPGGLWTINVANAWNSGDRDWRVVHGPSMRHVAEFTDDGIVSHWTLPGGMRHHRDSPYYENLVEGWLEVTPFVMPFKRADADAAAVETFQFEAL